MLIEHHMEYGTMDPVFNPVLNFYSDSYRDHAEAQMRSMFTDKINDLSDNYALLADVIDMADSNGFKNGSIPPFRTDEMEIILKEGAIPGSKSSLETANSVADALVLQYYEEPDEVKAAFGHKLTFEDWKKISAIKELNGEFLLTTPLVSVNVAHPLLQEIRSEMKTDGRLFTFLCGHDSNVGSILAALEAEEFELPNAIETRTPIGCKIVFTKWNDSEGKDYWGVNLVYLMPDQLRGMPLLDQGNSPMISRFRLRVWNKMRPGFTTKRICWNVLIRLLRPTTRLLKRIQITFPQRCLNQHLLNSAVQGASPHVLHSA